MLKFKKSEITEVTNKLTVNSGLFGDEVSGVTSQLVALSNSANEYGCALKGMINTYWGETVEVCALPDKKKHYWSF